MPVVLREKLRDVNIAPTKIQSFSWF